MFEDVSDVKLEGYLLHRSVDENGVCCLSECPEISGSVCLTVRASDARDQLNYFPLD